MSINIPYKSATIDPKQIAIFTMLIDHIGLVFFPKYLIFRIIGRISFPLFAWGIAQGAIHTHNWQKYALRLFFLAVLSQYPFYLFGRVTPYSISDTNVLFTLLIGLLTIQVIRSKLLLIPKLSVFYLLFYLCLILDPDYGVSGVLTIVISYLFMNNFPVLIISQLLIFSYPLLFNLILGNLNIQNNYPSYIGIFAPLAFVLIRYVKTKSNPKSNYLLYFIYPLQFLIIYLTYNLLGQS